MSPKLNDLIRADFVAVAANENFTEELTADKAAEMSPKEIFEYSFKLLHKGSVGANNVTPPKK